MKVGDLTSQPVISKITSGPPIVIETGDETAMTDEAIAAYLGVMTRATEFGANVETRMDDILGGKA